MESLKRDYQLESERKASFSKRSEIPIYTGPSSQYHRSASGKASVGTGSTVYTYGKLNGAYLVEYKVTAGKHKGSMRRGYILPGSISGKYSLNENEIPCANEQVILTRSEELTDEPRAGQIAMCDLKKGTEATLLFFDGNLACIEVEKSPVGRVQGYLPADAIELVRKPGSSHADSDRVRDGEPALIEALADAAGVSADMLTYGDLRTSVTYVILDAQSSAMVSDIGLLADCYQLTELRIPGQNVRDLSPLAALENLKTLVLTGNPVKDLTPVSGLGLTKLYLDRTQVDSLYPLSSMGTLRTLSISDTLVTSLSPVSGLPLVTLSMYGLQVQDIDVLGRSADTLRNLNIDVTRYDVVKLRRMLPLARINNE